MTPGSHTPNIPSGGSQLLGTKLEAGMCPVEGYVLISRLGRGGFGEVWKATGPGGFEVALKFIRLEDQSSSAEIRALDLMRGIRHPHLLSVFGAWEVERLLVMAMELGDGSLGQRLKHYQDQGMDGIPAAELHNYLMEAAKAIDYLNSLGVQHRDIKPGNILLAGGGVKVADFGLARVLEKTIATTSGSMTPAYAPPEMVNNQVSDTSDQYSLAISYCELRGGRKPFEGNLMALLAGHLHQPPDLTMIPEHERPAVARALAKKPAERWPSCREFAAAVNDAARAPVTERFPESALIPGSVPSGAGSSVKHHSTAADPVASAPVPPGPARSNLIVLGIVAVGIATAAVVAVAWWPVGPGGPKPLTEPRPQSQSAESDANPAPAPRRADPTPRPPLGVPEADITLYSGGNATFSVAVNQDRFDGPVRVSCNGLPPGVAAPFVTMKPGDPAVELTVTADPRTPPVLTRVTVRAEGRDIRHEATVGLRLLAVPWGYQAADEEMVTDRDGRPYFKKLLRRTAGEVTGFLLIPRTTQGDPPTFYMMKDKATLGLFAQFRKAHPVQAGTANPANTASDPRLPVLGVSVADASRCARWLGGDLPTTDQWDKASGCFELSRGEGPYRGAWNPAAPLKIAVNLKAPHRVGTASDDVSPFGCRDMSGNGLEWTRNLSQSRRTVPVINPTPDDFVQLRGKGYEAPEPFRFQDLEESRLAAFPYQQTAPDIGFRVAVEP